MYTALEVSHPYEFEHRPDWAVDIGIAAGCTLGYVLAWVGLVSYFYPNHWAAGVTGALAGCLVGWLYLRLARKDG